MFYLERGQIINPSHSYVQIRIFYRNNKWNFAALKEQLYTSREHWIMSFKFQKVADKHNDVTYSYVASGNASSLYYILNLALFNHVTFKR